MFQDFKSGNHSGHCPKGAFFAPLNALYSTRTDCENKTALKNFFCETENIFNLKIIISKTHEIY